MDKNYCVGDYIDVYYPQMIEVNKNLHEITPKLVEISDFKLEEGVSYYEEKSIQ